MKVCTSKSFSSIVLMSKGFSVLLLRIWWVSLLMFASVTLYCWFICQSCSQMRKKKYETLWKDAIILEYSFVLCYWWIAKECYSFPFLLHFPLHIWVYQCDHAWTHTWLHTQSQANKDHKIVEAGSERCPSKFLMGISTEDKWELIYNDMMKLLRENVFIA